MSRLQVALAMAPGLEQRLFAPATVDRLRVVADVDPHAVLADFGQADPARLAHLDALVTGWGCPPLDDDVLHRMPRLAAVVHAAGSVKHHLPQEFWRHGIPVSSAADANAVPVAEFTLAAIIFAGKQVLDVSAHFRRTRALPVWEREFTTIGNFGKRVGVVGASRIGRRVMELLRHLDVEVLLADPYVDEATAAALGARWCELDELVATCDVVSLHAPDVPETHHMIDARRLAVMPDGATLINTARGALIDQDALLAELVSGRLHAVLDVTTPEVPPADSPLYDLSNVLLTPHLAGSLGTELHRLGDAAVSEIERLAAGRPMASAVDAASLHRSA